jgi:hypothetical protein
MFALTWVVIDFVIALIITRPELRDAPPPPTMTSSSPPPPVRRARLPRAVARPRR